MERAREISLNGERSTAIVPSATEPAATKPAALRYRRAFYRIEAEIAAVPPELYVKMILDVPTVVTTVLGVVPKLAAFRPSVVDELPRFDIALYDKLETYALAAGFAHLMARTDPVPPAVIAEHASEVSALRDALSQDAAVLARRGLVDGKRLQELRGTTGFKNTAFDLMQLCTLLRDRWEVIEDKTAITLGELDRAEDLADRLATEVGEREQSIEKATRANETRRKAFSLLVRSYDKVRRAIGYLRWEDDDADGIAPSLYSTRKRGKKLANERKAAEQEVEAPPPPMPTTPEQAGGEPNSAPLALPLVVKS